MPPKAQLIDLLLGKFPDKNPALKNLPKDLDAAVKVPPDVSASPTDLEIIPPSKAAQNKVLSILGPLGLNPKTSTESFEGIGWAPNRRKSMRDALTDFAMSSTPAGMTMAVLLAATNPAKKRRLKPNVISQLLSAQDSLGWDDWTLRPSPDLGDPEPKEYLRPTRDLTKYYYEPGGKYEFPVVGTELDLITETLQQNRAQPKQKKTKQNKQEDEPADPTSLSYTDTQSMRTYGRKDAAGALGPQVASTIAWLNSKSFSAQDAIKILRWGAIHAVTEQQMKELKAAADYEQEIPKSLARSILERYEPLVFVDPFVYDSLMRAANGQDIEARPVFEAIEELMVTNPKVSGEDRFAVAEELRSAAAHKPYYASPEEKASDVFAYLKSTDPSTLRWREPSAIPPKSRAIGNTMILVRPKGESPDTMDVENWSIYHNTSDGVKKVYPEESDPINYYQWRSGIASNNSIEFSLLNVGKGHVVSMPLSEMVDMFVGRKPIERDKWQGLAFTGAADRQENYLVRGYNPVQRTAKYTDALTSGRLNDVDITEFASLIRGTHEITQPIEEAQDIRRTYFEYEKPGVQRLRVKTLDRTETDLKNISDAFRILSPGDGQKPPNMTSHDIMRAEADIIHHSQQLPRNIRNQIRKAMTDRTNAIREHYIGKPRKQIAKIRTLSDYKSQGEPVFSGPGLVENPEPIREDAYITKPGTRSRYIEASRPIPETPTYVSQDRFNQIVENIPFSILTKIHKLESGEALELTGVPPNFANRVPQKKKEAVNYIIRRPREVIVELRQLAANNETVPEELATEIYYLHKKALDKKENEPASYAVGLASSGRAVPAKEVLNQLSNVDLGLGDDDLQGKEVIAMHRALKQYAKTADAIYAESVGYRDPVFRDRALRESLKAAYNDTIADAPEIPKANPFYEQLINEFNFDPDTIVELKNEIDYLQDTFAKDPAKRGLDPFDTRNWPKDILERFIDILK